MTLSFACNDLPNLDTFTRSDGMVVIYKRVEGRWQKIGNTEVIHDSLNPVWVKSFDLQYHFEQSDQYKAVVYDIDDHNNIENYESHDYIGELVF